MGRFCPSVKEVPKPLPSVFFFIFIFFSGNIDKGQLGHKRKKLTQYREFAPKQIDSFEELVMKKIAAGEDHAMAVAGNRPSSTFFPP